MPTGQSRCPVCQGTGIVKEDTRKYEFITRDPKTNRCLVCNGEGYLNARSKLPNGAEAHTILPKKGLNVSKKRAVEPAETAGEAPEGSQAKPAAARGAGYWCGQATSMGEGEPKLMMIAADARLGELLESDRNLVALAETEPYYREVYRMIRAHGRAEGSWRAEDEERYVAYLEGLLEAINNKIKEAEDA